MSGLDPECGVKMMEIKVTEMNATINQQRGNERSQKLTPILKIGVNLMER